MGRDDPTPFTDQEREYLEHIRRFGDPKEVGDLLRLYHSPKHAAEFHLKLMEYIRKQESRARVYKEVFHVLLSIGGIGGAIITIKSAVPIVVQWIIK